MLDPIAYFAETDSRNKRVKFGIKASDRTRHIYVIGKTGMGKSTLLENMAVQDIQGGQGMAFIDPHGKTAELLLEYVPKERINDVIYFAPFDLEYPISFNVMEDVGYEKRHLVANGLMSAFKKIWVDAWSARMEYILNNILLSLLEYPDSTLIGVNRMLVDKDYRKKVVDNITDPSVKSFWTDEFARYGDRYMQEAGAAIQNKIGQFVSNPMIRNIIGQTKSSFDIRKIMDEKKILIINLSKGRVGEGNANLLGSMLITKIYLGAMSRADAAPSTLSKLPNFYLYVDEFQSFANESFADILSEARKYKLNLTIAHQYIEQMSDEVRAAVFGNVGSMISFRVGAIDAEVLEKEFAPQFTAQDLVNLGFVQIYLKLMIDGVTSQPFSATTLPPIAKPLVSYKSEIIRASRENFARSRVMIEMDIREWHKPVNSVPQGPGGGQNSGGNRGQVKKDFNPRFSESQSKEFSANAFSKSIVNKFENRGDSGVKNIVDNPVGIKADLKTESKSEAKPSEPIKMEIKHPRNILEGKFNAYKNTNKDKSDSKADLRNLLSTHSRDAVKERENREKELRQIITANYAMNNPMPETDDRPKESFKKVDNKGPQESNVNQLKRALEEAFKNNARIEKLENKQEKIDKKEIKEIPEEVLRNTLKMKKHNP